MNVTAPSFPWVKEGARRYRQQLDSSGLLWNRWYRKDVEAGHGALAVVSYCRFRSSLTSAELEARLQKAWRAMRYFNPGIACKLEEFYRTYEVPNESEVERWMRETFHIHALKTMDEVIQGCQHDLQPVMHFWPNRRDGMGELLLSTHHHFTDGHGALYLWDTLFKLVDKPLDVSFGDEAQYLPFARSDLLGLPRIPNVPSFLKAAHVLSETFLPDTIGLPRHDTGRPGIKDRCLIFRQFLSVAQTSAIMVACKERRLTVSAAFRAAQMLVCQAVEAEATSSKPSQSPRNKYMTIDMFDTRPWFRELAVPDRNLGTDFHASIPSLFDLEKKDFREVANDVNTWLKETRAQYKADPTGLDALAMALQPVLCGDLPAPRAPVTSSLGVLDDFVSRKYGSSIEVDDTWNFALGAYGPITAWVIYTFRDRFQVVACCNEAYFEPAIIQKAMRDTTATMLKGLKIEDLSGLEASSWP
jgi:hypothetical protein